MGQMAVFLRQAILCFVALPVMGSSFHFQSPVCGSAGAGALLTGQATLAVSGVPGPAIRVVYSMGSHRIGTENTPPFAFGWNSAIAMDGDSAIQAVAYNAAGLGIASAECLVRISNRQASLTVNSPDLTQDLSGVVSVSVTGSDAIAFPAVWTLNVDGEQQSVIWTDNTWQTPLTVSFQLDTTRFANGSHELHISMNSRTGPVNPQWVNWRGMVNRVVQFQNGHTWMDVVPSMQNVYLSPGAQTQLGCTRLYTDGVNSACGAPTYSSQDFGIAQIGPSGTLTAASAGFTRVTVGDGAKSATARIWVDTDHHIPHFAGNGEMRRGYLPGSSLFVIAPFFLDANVLSGDVGLQQQMSRDGVNTLTFGIYQNPWNTTTSFADWQASYDQVVAPKMAWAAQNGFHLLLTGDDIFRRIGGDAWFTLNWPHAPEAVQYAMRKFLESGVGIGVEGIDEASSIWGPRPVPEGRIGQAPYVFDQVNCQAGLCTVHWPSNPLPTGAAFALSGSSTPALDTAAGSLFTVSQATSDGFQFTSQGSVTGKSTQACDPGLEYLWFAGNSCSGGSVCNPQVPNNALATIRSWMNGGGGNGVHMAFPPLAVDAPTVHGAWMGPGSISDYASNYFSSVKTRTTYPWSEGIQEMVSSLTQQFEDRQPYLMLDRPQLMLVSLAGPSYTKEAPAAATYQAGTDLLDEPGVGPDHVSAVMMTAAALGGAGVRLYYFEPPSNLQSRMGARVGTQLQTGSNPMNLQSDSWQAMSYAATLLGGVLQPYLLGTAGNSPAYGRNIVTAVRSSGHGMMLMVVNGNDWARTIPVDFRPYLTSGGTTEYRLRSTGVTSSVLNAGMRRQTVTLGPGETVVYLFPNGAGAQISRANSLF